MTQFETQIDVLFKIIKNADEAELDALLKDLVEADKTLQEVEYAFKGDTEFFTRTNGELSKHVNGMVADEIEIIEDKAEELRHHTRNLAEFVEEQQQTD